MVTMTTNVMLSGHNAESLRHNIMVTSVQIFELECRKRNELKLKEGRIKLKSVLYTFN